MEVMPFFLVSETQERDPITNLTFEKFLRLIE